MPQPRHHADHAARQRAYRARQAQARADALPPTPLPAPPALPTIPPRARWQALLTQAQLALTTLQTEMHTYYDARSETWQESDRGAALAEQLDQLDLVLDELAALSAADTAPGR